MPGFLSRSNENSKTRDAFTARIYRWNGFSSSNTLPRSLFFSTRETESPSSDPPLFDENFKVGLAWKSTWKSSRPSLDRLDSYVTEHEPRRARYYARHRKQKTRRLRGTLSSRLTMGEQHLHITLIYDLHFDSLRIKSERSKKYV